MMIVRQGQIDAFAEQAEAAYTKSAADHLAKFDPVLAHSAGEERLQEAAANGLEAARSHDLVSGPGLQLYLETMASLGSEFDRDPQYSWLKPFLDRRQDMGSVERARFLHFHTSAYISRAYGANNEFAQAAVERAHEQLERFAGSKTASEIQPTELLKWLHPQRLDFVDSGAAAMLSGEARAAAAAAQLPMPQGANVLLILIFLFGCGVASDPLYPWVKAALQRAESGPDRLNHLVDDARKHLADILRGMKKEES
jgi:hypothetical protein